MFTGSNFLRHNNFETTHRNLPKYATSTSHIINLYRTKYITVSTSNFDSKLINDVTYN